MRSLGLPSLAYFSLAFLLMGCVKEALVSSSSKAAQVETQGVSQAVHAAETVQETIDLKRCARKSDGAAISFASLVVLSNGDMIFSGAMDGQKQGVLARINFSDMSMRTVSASAAASRGNTLSASTADNRTMAYYTTRYGYFVYTSPEVSYSCEPVTTASILSTSSRTPGL